VSWSCFYDASDSDRGTYLVSSAPTFLSTGSALTAVLRHFQWKHVVLVVEGWQRYYADLAAYVTYVITDEQQFNIELVVHLRADVTSQSAERSLRVINAAHAQGP